MTIVTSNQDKIKEFKSFFGDTITIESGKDIKEVNGTVDEVIIHKAKDAGDGYVVEDTILIVNGKEVVDIRWKLDELQEGDEATWITSFGYNKDGVIKIYRGTIDGIITKCAGDQGFAFDPFFIPKKLLYTFSTVGLQTLHQLGENKRYYSARVEAMKNMRNDTPITTVKINTIPEWTGTYQNQ